MVKNMSDNPMIFMNNKKWYAILLCGAFFCSTAQAVSDERAIEIVWGSGQVFVGWTILPVTPVAMLASLGCLVGAAGSLCDVGARGVPDAVLFMVLAAASAYCAWIPVSLMIKGIKNIHGKGVGSVDAPSDIKIEVALPQENNAEVPL